MAIVADLAGVGAAKDVPLSNPNRILGGVPSGGTAPMYPGERVVDFATGQVWRGFGTTTVDWQITYER